MNKYFSVKDISFFLLSFFIPLVLFKLTSSQSLMFDDAGEFALVVNLGSIAHPPGTPAYIFAGMLWTKILSLFGMNTIDSLTLFSSICISLSSFFLYCIFRIIAANLRIEINLKTRIACCISALSFSTAATSWAWANTVEVYSFQALAMAIALFGLITFHFDRKKISLYIASIGIAAGLANHHLTMILFLPFTPIFFLNNVFVPEEKISDKKKIKKKEENYSIRFLNVLKQKNFITLTAGVFVLTILFYGWMFLRAQNDYKFMFGKPDTISELFYHVSGGSYSKNISETSGNIITSRFPYFLKLTMMQLFVFLPFFISGIFVLLKRKMRQLFTMIFFYFLMLFIYQLNNNQWSSTDAYMLLPFMLISFLVFYGVIFYVNKIKAQFILPVLLCIQVIYNYPSNDRKSYDVSDSLMDLLDKSAPKNSVILIADWSVLIQYYYYRIVENFRPDLVVLNYDFKFTYYRILPVLYPDFYALTKPEYDNFIRELEKSNPHQIRNTGCDLNTPQLVSSFRSLLNKIEGVAKSQNRFLLADPRANYFYTQNKYYNPERFVSGCFSSSMLGDTAANSNFLKMDFPFLKSKMLMTDPAALDKLVDYQAMLDSYVGFYQANNDSMNLTKAQFAHDRIIDLQRKMKKSMSFAYKVD